MYAIEIFNVPDQYGRQIDAIVEHAVPFADKWGAKHFTDLWLSHAYFCPKCVKIWATRTTILLGDVMEFHVHSDHCPKCGPVDTSGMRGGHGRILGIDRELEAYVERLPLPLKISEFFALLREHDYEEDSRQRIDSR